MEVSGQLHGHEHKYPLNRRLGGPHSRSRHFGEGKNLLLLLGFILSISQSIAQSLY